MEWFKTWFASPYYHILYKNRDDNEAQQFIAKLADHLNIQKGDKVLDLACGAGRHSIQLNKLGFKVTGVDLSEPSINKALESANESLEFYVHDMRNMFRMKYYDFTLNLFTSFGYFERESDNVKTLIAAKKGLRPNGKIIIDFMNATKVVNRLVASETKTVDGITFEIERKLENGFIQKSIQFTDDKGMEQDFTEMVQFIDLDKFKYFCEKAGLNILNTFGSYELDAFDPENSNRLILELTSD